MFISQFFFFSYSKLVSVPSITKNIYDDKKYSQFCNFSPLDQQYIYVGNREILDKVLI